MCRARWAEGTTTRHVAVWLGRVEAKLQADALLASDRTWGRAGLGCILAAG